MHWHSYCENRPTARAHRRDKTEFNPALGLDALIAHPGCLDVILVIVIGDLMPFSANESPQDVMTTGLQISETIPNFEELTRHREPFESASLHNEPILKR